MYSWLVNCLDLPLIINYWNINTILDLFFRKELRNDRTSNKEEQSTDTTKVRVTRETHTGDLVFLRWVILLLPCREFRLMLWRREPSSWVDGVLMLACGESSCSLSASPSIPSVPGLCCSCPAACPSSRVGVAFKIEVEHVLSSIILSGGLE